MISDDEIRNLPEDPKAAFVEYVRLLREVVAKQAPNSQDESVERSYVGHIRAFADTHSVGLTIENIPSRISNEFWAFYLSLEEALDYEITKIR